MATGTGYTIAHVDGLERNGRWRLVRRTLGIGSFGCNLVELEPGYTLPEHDETPRDQEELFFVLSGDAIASIEDERHPAPAGTLVRVDPGLRRTIANESDAPVRVLIVSAPRTSGYEPMEWA